MADNMSASEDTNINEKGAKLLAERKESPLVAKLTLGLGSLITLIVLVDDFVGRTPDGRIVGDDFT